jgi:hypothetical protein
MDANWIPDCCLFDEMKTVKIFVEHGHEMRTREKGPLSRPLRKRRREVLEWIASEACIATRNRDSYPDITSGLTPSRMSQTGQLYKK